MNSSDNLFFTGLEKGELDIRESHINCLSFLCCIAESVQVAL